MTPQEIVSAHYRQLVITHGAAPEGTQWSAEGQRFRFDKLAQIADLAQLDVLDLGCGTGALYPFLTARFPGVRYHGVDIVPEMIETARRTFPGTSFAVCDPLAPAADAASPLGQHDVVLASGVFNNARPDADDFIRAMLRRGFAACRRAFGFNFISTVVNRRDDEMAYHDPADILRFCMRELSPRVALHHHYERCDVAVFVYR